VIALLLAVAWVLFGSALGQDAAPDLTTIPRGKGLPVNVRIAAYFEDIAGIADNEGKFGATVDLRQVWDDPRLAFPASDAPSGFVEWKGDAADSKLAAIWTPGVALANLVGDPAYELRGVRIYPNGRVELLQRTTGEFASGFDVHRFPFDHQRLSVEIASRRDPDNLVQLDFRQADIDFSRVSDGVAVDGWSIGAVALGRDPQVGWHGKLHARLRAEVAVTRDPWSAFAPIFVPLFASLLIPMLALWLNGVENGEFKVEAFELANVLIGGLFAVIALNFTVNSEWTVLTGDNPVAELFGLNYALLGLSIVINIALMRFNLLTRWFGKHVQDQAFLVLVWALPAVVIIAAGTVLLYARA
jgi:hypothetical protein